MYFEPRERLARIDSGEMGELRRAGRRLGPGVSSTQFSVAIISASEGAAQVDSRVREAQRLRYRIFYEELGAHPGSSRDGIDEDIYDAFCDHLIVRDNVTQQVVGTYRILSPDAAKRLGYYSDTEFLTTRLNHLKPNLVEFGRSCVHPDYRSGAVIMLLWGALAQYMLAHGYEHVIGCASISMRDGGHQAASLFNRLKATHFAPPEYHVFPRNPLPLAKLSAALDVEAPPLVKGYLRIGAQICGDPAWDPDFNSADFFMLLSLSRMNPRYAKHFGITPAPA